MIYVPFSTMSDLKDTHYLDGICIDYEGMDHDKVVEAVRSSLAFHHDFKPEDKRAVFVFEPDEDMLTSSTSSRRASRSCSASSAC